MQWELRENRVGILTIYQAIMPVIHSNMFFVMEGKDALIIDPNGSPQAMQLMKEHGIERALVLLTHEHFDHIAGVNALREQMKCQVIGNQMAAERVQDPHLNLAKLFLTLFITKPEEEQAVVGTLYDKDYRCSIDLCFKGRKLIDWAGQRLELIETPGHSPACICIRMNDKYLFSGDSLVEGAEIILRLPGSSKKAYHEITEPFLKDLPADTIVFPGHGSVGTLADIF